MIQCGHRGGSEPSDIRIHTKRKLFLQVFVVDNIPLLVNGKTDRQALLRRYKEQNFGNESKQTTYTAFQNTPPDKIHHTTRLYMLISAAGKTRIDRLINEVKNNIKDKLQEDLEEKNYFKDEVI